MTAKERLIHLIDDMSEPEAEHLLENWEHDLQKGSKSDIDAELQPTDTTSLFARLRASAESIPEEELQRLPTDLAENHDHYLYGTPKRNPVA